MRKRAMNRWNALENRGISRIYIDPLRLGGQLGT